MMQQSFRNFLAQRVAALLVLVCAGIASAQTPPPYVFSGPLLPLLSQMPENSWLHANANLFSNVWTPPDLEPLYLCCTMPPSKIINSWSGFGWDSNRGDLILFGGGHANYPGNDVYRWHSSSLLWERASLPSEIKLDPVLGYIPIDGVDNAPISSHTYDNSLFLPIADRFITWGGASFNNGYAFIHTLESNPTTWRLTGPYLFNPNRADGNKVGGTTGSHVQRVAPHPEIVGGQMWENRDIHKHLAGQALPGHHINGCTGSANEGGRDVVYVASAPKSGTALDLFRFQLTDIAMPAADQISKVGTRGPVGVSGKTTCGYDPVRRIFVRTGDNSIPFFFWDLTSPGPGNVDQPVEINASIANLQSWLSGRTLDIHDCALEFDPNRNTFPLWCGAETIWEINPPASGRSPSGWTALQRPAPTTPGPPGNVVNGVQGKWRYAPYYDVFVGLQDDRDGDIWIYKPVGWVQPNPTGNALPIVSVTSPADGTHVAPGTNLNLTASATDADGTIARVEYYLNGDKVGQASSPPYAVSFVPILVGAYSVVAVAVDNVGGMTASARVTFTASATLATNVLQRGVDGYAGVSDTYLDGHFPTTARGIDTQLLLDPTTFRPLMRFAVFQSEGGPVPDGAVIQSATLGLYLQAYNDPLQLNALLKPWVEGEATWNLSRVGVPWSVAGAAGAGTDYATPSDAVVTPDFSGGWVNFDVTARVRQWSGAPGANFGWRLSQTNTGSNLKRFNSSEYATDTTLRPTLTIVYALATGAPSTTTLASSQNPASFGTNISFTATVTGSAPTGTVAFTDGGGTLSGCAAVALPTGTADSKTATCSSSILAVGTHSIVATYSGDVANGGSASAALSQVITSAPSTTTLVLQRGVDGYAGVSDTYLDSYFPTAVRGIDTKLLLYPTTFRPLVRFAVFQSEGGPVPDGAVIQSATVGLYLQAYADPLQLNALLKPWVEGEATWNLSRAGVPWSVAGAAGAGTDYATPSDAAATPSFGSGWVSFDVTARVRQWSSAPGANFGWRLSQTNTGSNLKQFTSSEYAIDTRLRPTLTIVYALETGAASTTTLASSQSPASFGTNISFTATVTGSAPTGTVAFTDGGGTLSGCAAVALPTGTADSKTATCSSSILAVGTHSIVATYSGDVANGGSASAALSQVITSAPSTTTLVLQRGVDGYAGVSDTYLDSYFPTAVRGIDTKLLLYPTTFRPLVRFAVFQSEGGPVPDGAVIQSATVGLYLQAYADPLQLNALLKPWVEGEATWNLSRAGVPWSVAGAAGAGTDYATPSDAAATPSFGSGWVSFDVTARVRQWSSAPGANFGWRLSQTNTGSNLKQFTSSEYAIDTRLRPTLTIVYALETGAASTTTLASSQSPASFGTNISSPPWK